MRLLDLFSGIGGFSLGLEAAGFETVAFCEIDPVCRGLLAHHWPEVPAYDDITTLTADRLAADGIVVDAICGGFPCQDLSFAGKGAGLAGERSGLWREYARLIRELRPRVVIVENVAALLGRGLGDVLGDLAALGYDAVWDCIPAAAVGAPHRRDRLWIVAYARGQQHEGCGPAIRRSLAAQLSGAVVADAQGIIGGAGLCNHEQGGIGRGVSGDCGCNADQRLPAGHDPEADAFDPDPDSIRSHRTGMHIDRGAELRDEQERDPGSVGEDVADAGGKGFSRSQWQAVQGSGRRQEGRTTAECCSARPGDAGWGPAKSNLGRTFDGFSCWLDKNYGNQKAKEVIIEYANAQESGPREALQSLRCSIDEEINKRSLRGQGRVCAAASLLAFMRQLAATCEKDLASLEGTAAQKSDVRDVRREAEAACSSLRPELREQRPEQSSDSLRVVSQLLARYAEEAWLAYCRENAAPDFPWGPRWEDGIARVATGVPARAARLKGLGNAVVPQIPELIGRAIMEAMA